MVTSVSRCDMIVERNTAKVTADITVNVNANMEFALDQTECMISGRLG